MHGFVERCKIQLLAIMPCLTLWHIPQAIKYRYDFIFFPPAQKYFSFFLITFRFMLGFTGDVVFRKLGFLLCRPCSLWYSGTCWKLLPHSNRMFSFHLCSVTIITLFPWPPTQQNNSQVFVVERLMGLFCTIGGASSWLLSFPCSAC